MYYVNHLIWGLVMTSIGITLPGMINMTTVYISIKRGLRSAIQYNVGASVTIFVQALIALAFATYLGNHPGFLNFMKKAAVVLFFVLGVVFLYQALRTGAAKASKQRGHPFLLGVVVANMNVLTIPYFFAFSTFLEANNWLMRNSSARVLFGTGAMIGSFLLLSAYARFAQYVSGQIQSLTRNINLIMSGLFLLLAFLQLVEIFYG
jgi:threonine/homoserine/homoserine lactone efflux protein